MVESELKEAAMKEYIWGFEKSNVWWAELYCKYYTLII